MNKSTHIVDISPTAKQRFPASSTLRVKLVRDSLACTLQERTKRPDKTAWGWILVTGMYQRVAALKKEGGWKTSEDSEG